jgi:hypothetical protein
MGGKRGIFAIIAGVMMLLGVTGNGWALYHLLRAALLIFT